MEAHITRVIDEFQRAGGYDLLYAVLYILADGTTDRSEFRAQFTSGETANQKEAAMISACVADAARFGYTLPRSGVIFDRLVRGN